MFFVCCQLYLFFFFKQKTAYEMRISDWSSDVCSSDLLAIRKELLTKPSRLTAEEVAEMEAHVAHAIEFLQGIDFDLPVVETIAQMHERLNGEGYPQHLEGDAISLTGRILGACDVFCEIGRAHV